MDVQLDPVIELFIHDNFTHYMSQEIKKSFTLFDNYGMIDYDAYFIETLLLQDNADPQETIANVLAELNNKLDYILMVHGISLIDQTPLHYKNAILNGLYIFMDADMDSKEMSVGSLFDDAETTDEEKLCTVVSVYEKDTTVAELIPVIESVEPALIERMRGLLKEENQILTSNPESIVIYTEFDRFVKEKYPEHSITVVTAVILSSFPLGLPIEDYLPFMSQMLLELPAPDLVLNLFGLYVISSNYLQNDFVSTYTQFEMFFLSHQKSMPDSELFLQLSNTFSLYRKQS